MVQWYVSSCYQFFGLAKPDHSDSSLTLCIRWRWSQSNSAKCLQCYCEQLQPALPYWSSSERPHLPWSGYLYKFKNFFEFSFTPKPGRTLSHNSVNRPRSWTKVAHQFWYVMGMRADWKAFKQMLCLERDSTKNEDWAWTKYGLFEKNGQKYIPPVFFILDSAPCRYVGCVKLQKEMMVIWISHTQALKTTGYQRCTQAYHTVIQAQSLHAWKVGLWKWSIRTSCTAGI